MKEFFILEGAYIILGIIVLIITLFVTTRPFMGKNALKIGLSSVFFIVVALIFGHYYITTKRMKEVKEAFYAGKPILCENRIYTKGAQFITVNKKNDWKIEGDYFTSKYYTRKFHLARCIVE